MISPFAHSILIAIGVFILIPPFLFSRQTEEELEKAKAAGKKVLKAEPGQVSEPDTEQQGGHPEE